MREMLVQHEFADTVDEDRCTNCVLKAVLLVEEDHDPITDDASHFAAEHSGAARPSTDEG